MREGLHAQHLAPAVGGWQHGPKHDTHTEATNTGCEEEWGQVEGVHALAAQQQVQELVVGLDQRAQQ